MAYLDLFPDAYMGTGDGWPLIIMLIVIALRRWRCASFCPLHARRHGCQRINGIFLHTNSLFRVLEHNSSYAALTYSIVLIRIE